MSRRPADGPSRAMRFAIAVLSRETKPGDDPEAYRAAYERRSYPTPPPVPAPLRLVARVHRQRVDGFDVFTVTPKRSLSRPANWHIVYLHGGAYVDEMLSEHWEIVLNLVRFTGATVTVPCYPLGPEHTHQVGNTFVERVYRGLLEHMPPERVVLMGDSAGGGMCLVQAMRYRDQGLPPPARLIVFAPWADPRMVHPDIPALVADDPIQSLTGCQIAARWWAGSDDQLTHPHVNPLFGDVSGLPPVDIYLGTTDILVPDVRLMAGKLAAAGVEVSLVEYPGAIHVHVGAAFTREARDTYRRIARTLGVTATRASVLGHLVTSPAVSLTRQLVVRLTGNRSRMASILTTTGHPLTHPVDASG